MNYTVQKGGETMSLEAMKQVTQAEQATREKKAEAVAQARRAVEEAERAGRAGVDRARAEAEAQVQGFLKDAEQKASKQTEQMLGETWKTCDALREKAQGRMAEAVALITGRVVNN